MKKSVELIVNLPESIIWAIFRFHNVTVTVLLIVLNRALDKLNVSLMTALLPGVYSWNSN